jgi:signal transduction histidine kinase/ligand-binding sensor domain-containing protein
LKRTTFTCLFALGLYFQVYATDFQYFQFRVEDGLKTDIIKAINHDALGFIWIGSDEGLMQYNGYRFLHYPYATESPYIKDLIRLHDGRLLALNDLGLVEIINQIDTVIFRKILTGTRTPTDTSIWYPKSIFQDSRGNLWIGEPQSVVKYDGVSISRIEFSDEHNSSSFIRSFNFAELPDGRILISSYDGDFFTYNLNSGAFKFWEGSQFDAEVNHMLYWNHMVYLACNDGFYRITSFNEDRLNIEKIASGNNTAHILALSDESLLISSFTSASIIFHQHSGISEMPFKLTVVNKAFKSDEGNIWLSTEKGVVLLRPQIFERIRTDSENIYVESIALTPDRNTIYFSSKEHIRVFKKGAVQSDIFDIRRRGYFLSLQFDDNKLWASNGPEILLYNTNGTVVKSWDMSNYGRYIFDIVIDRHKNVWFTQEASKGLKMLDADGNLKLFNEHHGLQGGLTIVRPGKEGVYAGSNSSEAYLYHKNDNDTIFNNISLHIGFDYQGDFRIEDIAASEDAIWLATTVGLLRQTPEKLEKILLDKKFDDLLVKAVRIQEGTPFIWFNNAYGLIQYNYETNEYNIYDESHGLPSNTINTRAISISTDVIWLGTASGLAFSDFNFGTLEKTPEPYMIGFNADGRQYKSSDLKINKLPSHSYVEIIVSAPSYPSNKLRYQYKLNAETLWSDIPVDGMMSYSKLRSGNYSISFRAKKIGNYQWSNIRTYQFTVEKAFYETWYFYLAVLVLIVLLISITRLITTRLLRQRQQELARLVEERTAELAEVNASLRARNQELDQFVYSTSHDLSAPLKSIRGLINIANYESDINAQKSLLERMSRSVIKLEIFIRDVISYSRNARLDIVKSEIDLKCLVLEILDHISNLEYFHKIEFDIQIDEDCKIWSDETRLKIILNNLISNAVKFQRFEEEVIPVVGIHYKFELGRHHIKVCDNGQGIAPEYMDKIFDMFYRANITSDGSGLGLYILNETIKKLNGEVTVQSEEGKGSEFVVSFP